MKRKIFFSIILFLIVIISFKLYSSANTSGTGGIGNGTSGTIDGSGGWNSSVFGVYVAVFNSNNVQKGSTIEITESTISDSWIQKNLNNSTWSSYPTYLYDYFDIPYGTTSGNYATLKDIIKNISLTSGDYVLIEPYTQIGRAKVTFRGIINNNNDVPGETINNVTAKFYQWYENPAIILANAAKVGSNITVGGHTYTAKNSNCTTSGYGSGAFCGYTNDHYVGYGITVVKYEQMYPGHTNTITHWKYVGTGGDNGDGTCKKMDITSFTAKTGDTVTIPSDHVQYYTGYHNTGTSGSYWGTSTWSNKQIGSTFTQPNSSINIEYYYYPNIVKIAYHPNGGTTTENLNEDGWVKRGDTPYFHTISYNNSSDLYDANTFGLKRDGYRFVGWKVDSTGEILDESTQYSSTVFASHNDASITTANTSEVHCYLRAEWEYVRYAIKYDANGGTGTMADQAADLTLSTRYGNTTLNANQFTNQATITYDANVINSNDVVLSNTHQNVSLTFDGWMDHNSYNYGEDSWNWWTFDAPFYANKYNDLMNFFGYNKLGLINHWVQTTLMSTEQRIGSKLLNVIYYPEAYIDIKNAFGSNKLALARHWDNNGYGENRSGIENIDTVTSTTYPDRSSVANLVSEAGTTATLTAKWGSGTTQIDSSVNRSFYVFLGWNTKPDGSGTHYNVGDSITISADTTLYAQYKKQCEYMVEELSSTDKDDPSIRIALYKYFQNRTSSKFDYKNLLNFNLKRTDFSSDSDFAEAVCSVNYSCDNTVEVGCLSTRSSLVYTNTKTNEINAFNENNLSCYTEEITVTNQNEANITGYCGLSFDLKNKFQDDSNYNFTNTYTFPSVFKAGQLFLKKDDSLIAKGIVKRHCYFYNYAEISGERTNFSITRPTGFFSITTPDSQYNKTYDNYVDELKFNDYVLERTIDKKNWSLEKDTSNLKYYTEEYTAEYELPSVYSHKGDGSILYNEPENLEKYKNLGYGFISKFNENVETTMINVPFSFNVIDGEINSKTTGIINVPDNTCQYEYNPEIVKEENLDIEFRIIDTNNPFPGKSGTNRTVGSNWCVGADCSSSNSIVESVINSRIDSKYSCGAKYTIELTPDTIKAIREYNLQTTYDDYNLKCDENGENCESSFLNGLLEGNLKYEDNAGDEQYILIAPILTINNISPYKNDVTTNSSCYYTNFESDENITQDETDSNHFSITFEPNGGEFKKPGINLYNIENTGTWNDGTKGLYDVSENVVTVTLNSSEYYNMSGDIPIRTGYNFLGWYTDDGIKVYDSNGVVVGDGTYYDSNNIWIYEGNLTVYAHWENANSSKKCKLTSDSDGDAIPDTGDMVRCGTESFYVISNDGATISMLSQYNLNVGTNQYPNQSTYGIQDKNADALNEYGKISGLSSNYWYDCSNNTLYSQYDNQYPAWVYTDKDGNTNEKNYIYQYVEAYENYLNSLEINVQATVISYEQLIYLGCNSTDCIDSNYPWIYSTNYYTGFAKNYRNLATINYTGKIFESNNGFRTQSCGYETPVFCLPGANCKSQGYGVRPVINISANELN